MDKNYWEQYYKRSDSPQSPTPFARYILQNYLQVGKTLIELGCGNGRDSIFFASNGINVTGVDQCTTEIESLRNNNSLKNLDYVSADFTELGYEKKFNYVYSRFTLHSITKRQEEKLFLWIEKVIPIEGYIMIEARGKQNELYMLGEKVPNEEDSYVYEHHYRRFVDFSELCEKIINMGFEITFSQESKGFAPYKETDFTFLRVIAKKIK